MTHLIFIDGLPGSGKSESARKLAASLNANNRPARLFEETDPTNPLHTAALDPMGAAFADAHIKFNVHGFAEQSLQKYRDLPYSLRPDTTTIFESFPMQSHARVLLQMNANRGFIMQFWKDVQDALRPLAPTLVFFQEEDPISAIQAITKHRGEEWTRYIVSALEQTPYASARSLQGLDGICQMMAEYNELLKELNACWAGDNLTLPARPENYQARDAQIIEYFSKW